LTDLKSYIYKAYKCIRYHRLFSWETGYRRRSSGRLKDSYTKTYATRIQSSFSFAKDRIFERLLELLRVRDWLGLIREGRLRRILSLYLQIWFIWLDIDINFPK